MKRLVRRGAAAAPPQQGPASSPLGDRSHQQRATRPLVCRHAGAVALDGRSGATGAAAGRARRAVAAAGIAFATAFKRMGKCSPCPASHRGQAPSPPHAVCTAARVQAILALGSRLGVQARGRRRYFRPTAAAGAAAHGRRRHLAWTPMFSALLPAPTGHTAWHTADQRTRPGCLHLGPGQAAALCGGIARACSSGCASCSAARRVGAGPACCFACVAYSQPPPSSSTPATTNSRRASRGRLAAPPRQAPPAYLRRRLVAMCLRSLGLCFHPASSAAAPLAP